MGFFSPDGQLHKRSRTEGKLGLIQIVVLPREFNQVKAKCKRVKMISLKLNQKRVENIKERGKKVK